MIEQITAGQIGICALGASIAVGLTAIGAGIAEGGTGKQIIHKLVHNEISFGKGLTMVAIGESAAMYGFTTALFITTFFTVFSIESGSSGFITSF